MPPKMTSTSEAPAMTQAAIRQLVVDSVATALETQAATMANADNANRNPEPREAPIARKSFIGGLPRSIEGNVTASKPQTLEEAINIAQRLMDQMGSHKLSGVDRVNSDYYGSLTINTEPREARVARKCSCKEFMSCQPFNFKGTEGAVGLIRWFERTESVFSRSNYTEDCKVKFITGTVTEEALSWWNSFAQPIGIEEAYKTTWSVFKKLLIKKYCPRTEVKKIVMSSPNHPTFDIEDAFSSNSPNYTLASLDYSPASPGNTLSFFHDDPHMKVMHAYDTIMPPQVPITLPIIVPPSLMLSPIFNPQEFFVLEELLPPKEQVSNLTSFSTDLSNLSQKQACILVPPSFSVYTPTSPQIFEIGKGSIKMHLKHRGKQIEDILNYLNEISFHRIKKMKERLVNGWMII
nr:reverse transcriptase domain-containing protein [Tanacetum cinerariifolium]